MGESCLKNKVDFFYKIAGIIMPGVYAQRTFDVDFAIFLLEKLFVPVLK